MKRSRETEISERGSEEVREPCGSLKEEQAEEEPQVQTARAVKCLGSSPCNSGAGFGVLPGEGG